LTNGLTTNQAWLDCLQALSAHYTREIQINSHSAIPAQAGTPEFAEIQHLASGSYTLLSRSCPAGMMN
jgi:hypothetical protein